MDKVVKGIREEELGTFWGYLSGLPGLILGNMLFGLIVARFLRVKNEQDWLNDSEVV
jgi:predicted PurR-regulated permease PerM